MLWERTLAAPQQESRDQPPDRHGLEPDGGQAGRPVPENRPTPGFSRASARGELEKWVRSQRRTTNRRSSMSCLYRPKAHATLTRRSSIVRCYWRKKREERRRSTSRLPAAIDLVTALLFG